MNKDQFKALLDSTHKTLVDLTQSKGEEYSRDADQLANFKRQAEELLMTPEKVLMVYLNKHLDAVKSFVKTGKIYSEPIEGRIDDAILYLILLKGIVRDDQNRFALPTGRTLSGGIHPKAHLVPMTETAHAQTEDNRPQFGLE